MASKQVDVIIAGAGPAGLMCALTAARNGLSCVVLESCKAADHGHNHVLEVEETVFQRCDVPEPSGEEVPYIVRGLKAFSASGWQAFETDSHPMHIVILRHTVRRLAGYVKEAGVPIRFGVKAVQPMMEGDCVTGVVIRDARGNEKILRGRMVVDATGYAAAITRKLPASCNVDFTDDPVDRIIASVRLYRIDVDRARQAAEQGQFKPEVLHHTIGKYGTFSTLSFLVSLENGNAFTLAGIKEENFPPTPKEALDELVKQFPFFQDIKCQSSSPIRIRRASLKLVCDGFASIGEAASMVIPLQASGVTSSLLAGHSLGEHLAKVLTAEGTPTTAALWPWNAQYQRDRGAVLASYDAQRRALQKMHPEKETEPLFKAGITQAEDIYLALGAKPLRISAATLPARLKGMAQLPRVAAKMAPGLARVPLVEFHWKRCPLTWNEKTFASWKRTAQMLLP